MGIEIPDKGIDNVNQSSLIAIAKQGCLIKMLRNGWSDSWACTYFQNKLAK